MEAELDGRSTKLKASTKASGARTVQEILVILHKWGIHTVGQFAALDKEELGARLGPEAIRMWERANGQSNRLLKLVRPPESFEESFEFEHEIETAEPLLFMLRRCRLSKVPCWPIVWSKARRGTSPSDWRTCS